ncbi:MAG TPA: O-antigen ligase family protein, partial [Candidatus Atribacteria bacterium]|nr:O-antigen ligase family protein [Candidatus Atribacteria bacterium]
LVFLYYSIRLKYQTRRLLTVFAVLAMVTAVYILIVNRQLIERFASIFIEFKNVVTLSENYESGGSKRIFIWKCALQIIREHPFFGTGPETFSKVIYSRFSLHFFKAHNEYLNIAQSSGIPALIVYAAWLADVIRNGIKGIRKNIYILPYLASVTGYAVQAFFNVSIVAVAYIFWIFSGILVSTGTDINSKYSNY